MPATSPVREKWVPSNETDRQAIRAELDTIIASSHFRASARYPALLTYLVEKALEGDADGLKERTIGAAVFHQKVGYDTADHPIVRVCASEVRKRLAQFYRESGDSRSIELELPIGSYITNFWRLKYVTAEGQSRGDRDAHLLPASDAVAGSEQTGKNSVLRFLQRHIYAMSAVVLLLVLIGWGVAHRSHSAAAPLTQVWGPVLDKPDAGQIIVGTGYQDPSQPAEIPDLSISQHIKVDHRYSIASVSAVSHVAGFLQSQNKPYHIHDSDSRTLADLHQCPIVLVGGFTNRWTMRFLTPLRFHFVSEKLGEGHYVQHIKDSQHPESKGWFIDMTQPYARHAEDYAIVGRFYDASVNGPVVVIAGIYSNATEAAGEFMVSGDALAALARQAHSSIDKNFEAVLKVEVIDGNTGSVTVVASQFW